ncbi:hypothetical protein Pla52n_16190 [Stieleria varia]|uniref:Uncharacterized protein n=1 Tax=Stieleria varia TaxID=2528005 RepID=A0A5C6B160_9BACT|nr:hypothetical protein Pla52n_16190 [Stieleria varia]
MRPDAIAWRRMCRDCRDPQQQSWQFPRHNRFLCWGHCVSLACRRISGEARALGNSERQRSGRRGGDEHSSTTLPCWIGINKSDFFLIKFSSLTAPMGGARRASGTIDSHFARSCGLFGLTGLLIARFFDRASFVTYIPVAARTRVSDAAACRSLLSWLRGLPPQDTRWTFHACRDSHGFGLV